jgi:2-amino-4-hydroxy-6-hydroxymethyldihydropteridine diphosphokinase
MVKVVLGLGSNVGSRLSYIRKAVKSICLLPGVNYLAVSSVYETEPWGYKNQNSFLNCVLVCLCRRKPQDLFKSFKKIERSLGRKSRGKWQKREIDIDILFYASAVIRNKEIVIPHPQLKSRNFVLKPLAEMIPGFIHPLSGKTIAYLYKHSSDKNKVYLYSHKL